MYLKSIEVHGFKSFANKITFQFHNGITGIVGPNGSGKSNVADAVRWVLGEQRIKQLRGASMQDVIFAGTELRKPMSYAYVAITMDNHDHALAIDYDEVTIARRIYRSGESEYLINGTVCRLKDVSELFYDTGIGKEGYSIIGQGQIDKILSGKPEDRRELFDEAAGIVKYKKRKMTAQKKLEDEKMNLLRVSDILSELEKQRGPLEKQSEVAKVYLNKKQDLKVLDVNVFLLENQKIRQQLLETTDKFTLASEELASNHEEYSTIRKEYEEVEAQIEQLSASIEVARESLSNSSVLKGKLEGEINVLREQMIAAQGNREHLYKREGILREEVSRRTQEKDSILTDKEAIDRDVNLLEKQREEAKEQLLLVQRKMEELNFQMDVGKKQIIEALNERATIKSRLGRYDNMTEQIQIRKAEMSAKLLKARTGEQEQEAYIKELEEAFEEITGKIDGYHALQKEFDTKLAGMHDSLTGLDQQLRDTQVKYHQEKSKLEALTNMTERYEGYGGSVKKVMEQKDKIPGIVGVVADIIRVAPKYETAIETALGGNIQNIVTDNEDTAKKLIRILKDSKAGRATFLPLTSIVNPQEFKTPEVLAEPGVLGMADEIVDTEPEYRNVAKAMLGRIVVVDHVDHAVAIAKKYDYGVRMVTLEGELLIPGGAISGGTFKNASNLLGRRREMEELQKNADKYLAMVQKFIEDIEAMKQNRNLLREQMEANKVVLQEAFLEQNSARINVGKARERRQEVQMGLHELQKEQADIAKQMDDISKQVEQILRELEESEAYEKEIDRKVNQLQLELDGKKVEETQQSQMVSEWDLSVEKMLQKQEFQQENVNRIQGELQRYLSELTEVSERIESIVEEEKRKSEQIAQIEQTILASHTVLGNTETSLKEEMQLRENLMIRQKSFFKRREEMAEHIAKLDKEVYRLQSQKERMEEALEAGVHYMWQEYELTLRDAATMRNEELSDLGGMKRSIASLKEEIRKLGDVNVNAIEDYKELLERYTFLKTQHDDLVEAEKTLLAIITELDAAMRKQFAEKFGEINREFDKVFRELFGGGKGTLELMEEEDILEAGIRIIAQPPGKKLQNMMQLSGGEKALTAIALLFAIQNLKPSPFCLLDEIEAALDENNVERFAKYLHKLTKSTQFIVITHRRGTMAKADTLYGVTMQEKGVSALVSVNLIEKELE